MSMLSWCLSVFVAGITLLPATAQQVETFSSNSSKDNRTFALVRDKTLSVNGSWHGTSLVQSYAHAHPGHYIVFEEKGALYKLDDATSLETVERAYAPMAPLEARQRELEAEQKPLEEQQKKLNAQQQAAQGNPEEQGRIAGEQGRIGQQQGEIGRKQGEIGRQQGEIGRAFYNRVTSLIDTCLAENTCHRVQQ